MKIHNAGFVISNTDYKKCPSSNLPEYAFIGRSNVGKSSLINSLAKQKKLAKISSKPGKTQLINHFLINNNWYLVDLPGYGYAKTSKTKREEFQKMISEYLINRENLLCLFLLLDPRHKPQKIDKDFMTWLGLNSIPFTIIFTKADKLSSAEIDKNIKLYQEELLKDWSSLPEIFITSAKKKSGNNLILNFINNLKLNSSGLLSAIYKFEGQYFSEGVVEKKLLKLMNFN